MTVRTAEADPAIRRAASAEPVPAVLGNSTPTHTFRADIQGLRAVAVLLVVLNHAGLPGLSGGFVGVDVFFVISGFLITQGLVRELEDRGTVSLAGFYARRVRRILPAATVTLLAVAVATVLLLPQTRWLQIGRDILGSALYVVNWDLAGRAVDYGARGDATSPLQHFWSLAVEEQFYLVWPLSILAVVGLVRLRRGRGKAAGAGGPSRRHIWLPLGLIAVPSLVWSVQMTGSNPAAAYFVTTTRMWELALGAALALLPVRAVIRGPWAQVVQWSGLALILYSAVTFDETTAIPGYAALLPTLGAVAVLGAGAAGRASGRNPLLESGPMVWVGSISYSLYLWHWPVLILGTGVAQRELPVSQGLLLVALSVVPAWLSLRLVEQPVLVARGLRRDDVRSLQLGALCMLVALLVGLGVQQAVLRAEDAAASAAAQSGGAGSPAADPDLHPGAAALMRDPSAGEPADSFPSIVPAPLAAPRDHLALDRPGCDLRFPEGAPWRVDCTLGNPDGDTTLVLIGDSHAEHIAPAVEEVAVANGWRLDVHTSSACPLVAAATGVVEAVPSDCAERNDALVADLLADPPDAVLIGTSRYQVDGGDGPLSTEASRERMARGLRDAWAPLARAGIRVLVLHDVPRPDFNVPDCVAANPDRLSECAFDRDTAVMADAPEVRAAEALPGAGVIDLNPWICPGERCPAVIGGVLVYRDTDHLTATYVRTLVGALSGPLVDALR